MSGINEKKTIIELDEETDLKGVYLYGMKAEGPKSVKVDASKLKVSAVVKVAETLAETLPISVT